MTLNERPGNAARVWKWSILREPRMKTLPSAILGENRVPFGMGVDSILDVAPLLKASLRRFMLH
uniref:Uncharacterized protein n=1 Tax=Oryza nivara TaxID=4536 RepID=A0A0E0I095_ORYNI